jgi:aryl-alcohol dehydrogenase-like predicted oxidoreductase
LTGQIKSLERPRPRRLASPRPALCTGKFPEEPRPREQIERMAAPQRVHPSQLALAWVLHKGDDIIPIPGTKRIKYLEQNAGAANITLTPQEIAELDAALPPGAAAGTRYPEAAMHAVNR